MKRKACRKGLWGHAMLSARSGIHLVKFSEFIGVIFEVWFRFPSETTEHGVHKSWIPENDQAHQCIECGCGRTATVTEPVTSRDHGNQVREVTTGDNATYSQNMNRDGGERSWVRIVRITGFWVTSCRKVRGFTTHDREGTREAETAQAGRTAGFRRRGLSGISTQIGRRPGPVAPTRQRRMVGAEALRSRDGF